MRTLESKSGSITLHNHSFSYNNQIGLINLIIGVYIMVIARRRLYTCVINTGIRFNFGLQKVPFKLAM